MAQTQLPGKQIGPLDLTTEITGTLPVANGGTGASSITGAGIATLAGAETLTSKTLTDPKINQLLDTNGNVILNTFPGGSAVNYLGIGNTDSSGSPIIFVDGPNASLDLRIQTKGVGGLIYYQQSGAARIIVDGGDANIDFNLIPKGSGQVQANGVPVVTTTGAGAITNKTETLAAGSTSVAPLKFTSGTNLTTPAAGAVEYDGATFSGTIDTTSGRALSTMDQMFRLSADGAAIGPTIADYFGANSAFPYVASGVYEIVWYLIYTKTTAGTVTYTITSTTAPTMTSAWYVQSPVGGVGAAGAPQTAAIIKSTSTATVIPATAQLTLSTTHVAEVHAIYEAGTAGNLRLRVTQSAGTVTPLRGSFYRVRRLPAGNVGTFVA